MIAVRVDVVIETAEWISACLQAAGGNAALLSTNKAEAFWTRDSFLQLTLA